MIKLDGIPIPPTFFPDKTSQIWKISEDVLTNVYKNLSCEIEWQFENEGELMHVAQLKTLLDTYSRNIKLNMPYLPYGRQDKRIDNNSTFALHAFAKLINALEFNEVQVLDAHNNLRAGEILALVDRSARKYIEHAVYKSRANLLLFPDAGAKDRYEAYDVLPSVYAEKKRNQSTGVIEGMNLIGSVKGKRVILIDDICDGGFTFVLAAKAALDQGAKEVHLYVTHGIFSKGLQVLRDAGIKRIFTYKGEVS